MKTLTLAVFIAAALLCPCPHQLHAQQGQWYPGYPGVGQDCTNMSASNYCTSAVAACQSFAGTARHVTQFYPTGTVESYECVIESPFANTGIRLVCPTGYINDVNSPLGCSLSANPMYEKLIGIGFATPPPGAFGCSCSADVSSTGAKQAADPIDVATGNTFYAATDYETAGQNKLRLTRYYNSRGTAFLNLGANWRHNFNRSLIAVSGTKVQVTGPTGQILVFNLVRSVWTPDSDVDVTLTQSGTTWTLTNSDDSVETYTGSNPVLSTIKARNGYTQTLAYNSAGQLATVTDSYGRVLTFTYNSNNSLENVQTPDGTTISYAYTSAMSGYNLTSVSFPTSQSISYVYENTTLYNALTGVIDENNNRTLTWTYDNYGRGLTSYQGPSSLSANLTTIAYNDSTGTRTVTNALGETDTYTFSMLQGVPKITQISRAATSTTAAATETFTYDTNGYKASVTDWNGNQTTYVNNSHGLPTTINEAVGTTVARSTTIAYDPTWVHLPHTVTTPGLTYGFTYDTSGEGLTKVLTDTTTNTVPYSTNGQTRTWTKTYSNALLTSIETPNSNTTTLGYSPSGALTSITDAKGHVTNITAYSGGGLPTTIVDPNSVTTTVTYDGRQRVLTSVLATTAGNLTTSNVYYNNSDVITTWPDGSALIYQLDNAHRLQNIVDSDNSDKEVGYDANSNRSNSFRLNSSYVIKYQRNFTFDALNHMLTNESQTTGLAYTYSYDNDGNPLTITDPLTHVTTNVFDALNRLSTSTDPNAGVLTETYDAHDRPLTVKDQNGNTTSYVYTGFGDVSQQTSPDTGTTVYHYDGDSNLTSKTDALGVVMNQTFDALDRPLTTTYPADSTQNVAFTYDQTGHGFGVGRLTSMTDAAGTLSRSYDERGNILTEQRIKGTTTLNTAYTYDGASRILTITYPSGLLVTYTRDAAGLITAVAAKPSGGSSTTLASGMTYEPWGPLTASTGYNGVSQAFAFDEDYRGTSVTASGTSGSLLNLAYTLDANDNVTGITDSLNAANTQTLGYDVINRLTSAASGTGGYGSYTYALDKVGNRLTQVIGGATTTYGYAAGSNKLASILAGGVTTPVSTNANGNITSIPTANTGAVGTFSYNVANRLSSVTGASTAYTAIYDAFGRRITKTDTGTNPSYYTYGLDSTMLEENDNGTVTDYIYANGTSVGIFAPATSGLYYVLTDRQGVPQKATNSSQAVVWSTTYQPFGTTGTVTASITQNLRFPGQFADPETGFYYNQQRDYMPNLGRYLQSDPIGLGGGINTFAYAGLNPNEYQDSNGLWQVTMTVGIGFAGQLTFGRNSGQWNLGSFLGAGLGVSGTYDPTNKPCQPVETDWSGRESFDAEIGKLGVDFGAEINTKLDASVDGTLNTPMGSYGGSLSSTMEHPRLIFSPEANTGLGLGTFMGVGGKITFR